MSYNTLDAAAAAGIWKGLDTRALQRAFSTLSKQDLSFEHCDIDVNDLTALAVCTGVLSYVRKVSDDEVQSRRMTWTFDLRRAGTEWAIAGLIAR